MPVLTWGGLALSAAALLLLFFTSRRLRRLEERLEQLQASPPSQQPPGPQRAPFDSVELTLGAMLEELETKGQEILQQIDQRLKQTPSKAAHVPQKPQPTTRSEGNRAKADAVYRLAEEGHDIVAIAQRLGLGKGEVQLILDLRRQTS